jgi:tetratricopeptide (TPR) repeat protein
MAGMAATFVDYDWPAAEREFRIAMAIDPIPAAIRYAYAHWLLLPLRRFDAAIDQWRLGLETDPLSGLLNFGMAFTLYLNGDVDAALEHAATAIEVCSDFWLIRYVIGMAQLQKGQLPQAIASLEQARAVGEDYPPTVGTLAACYALTGRPGGVVPASSRARTYYHAMLGDPDQMFAALDEAITAREYLVALDVNAHVMTPYRTDPRFPALLRRMKLE